MKGVEIIMNARGSSAKYQALESSSLKCCIVGDTKSGKTALAYRLQAQEFRGDYSATSFDNYSGKIITCSFNHKVTWFPPYPVAIAYPAKKNMNVCFRIVGVIRHNAPLLATSEQTQQEK